MESTIQDPPEHVFREGDHALIVDRRGRRYLERLYSSGQFHSHLGGFRHEELLGREEGSRIMTGTGHRLLAVKPTMGDLIREMPRIATVIYPKDIGAILVYGDINPGARVLEAGTGSGALTIALSRAVGDTGQVVSYDIRQDMLSRAEQNIRVALPEATNLTFKQGDVYHGFPEVGFDRIVLDLPEPWNIVPNASESLVPGGLILSFLPTVLQVRDFTLALRSQRTFDLIETLEVLVRLWKVGSRSVRPDHRMIGHTGFITTARRCDELPHTESAEEITKGIGE